VTHPPASYLSPEDVEAALEMARELQRAAAGVRLLMNGASGAAVGGAGAVGLGTGRAAAVAIATREWIGPHRDTFLQLIEDEVGSADATTRAMEEEADAWAAFWAEATNARLNRLHELAMADHRLAMNDYERRLDDYTATIAADPATLGWLSPPRRPTAPPAPSPVAVPRAVGGYRATG
jgi:hypothetical protein